MEHALEDWAVLWHRFCFRWKLYSWAPIDKPPLRSLKVTQETLPFNVLAGMVAKPYRDVRTMYA
jgi:hypothetical protein